MPTVNVKGVGTVNFPDSMTPDQIQTALRTMTPPDSLMQATPARPAAGQQGPGFLQRFGTSALNQLPAIGGAVGATIGGLAGLPEGGVPSIPLGIGGAAIGGYGGEAAKQLISRAVGLPAPQTPEEALRLIRRAGPEQGLAQAAGEGLGVGAQMTARGLMRGALRPTARMLDRDPKLIENALEQGARVGLGGSRVARGRVAESSRALNKTLVEARRRGWSLSAEELRPALETYIDDNVKGASAHWQDRAAELRKAFDSFVEQNPGRGGPLAVKRLKQGEQLSARAVYDKRASALVAPDQLNNAQTHAALASLLKDALETIPGVAGREAKTQAAIGVSNAVRRAEHLRPALGAHMLSAAGAGAGGVHGGVPEAIGGYLLAHVLSSPTTLSLLAQGANNPMVGAGLRQLPRFMLAGMPPPQQSQPPIPPALQLMMMQNGGQP